MPKPMDILLREGTQHLAGEVSPEFTAEVDLRGVDCSASGEGDEIKVGSEWNQKQKRYPLQGHTGG